MTRKQKCQIFYLALLIPSTIQFYYVMEKMVKDGDGNRGSYIGVNIFNEYVRLCNLNQFLPPNGEVLPRF